MAGLFSSPQIAIPLLLLAVVFGLLSVTSWIRALKVLSVVVLFGGVVGARLGITAMPIVLRDVAIVLPLYIAFLSSGAAREALSRMPPFILLGILGMLAWLAICLLNPEGVSGLRLLIGLKVWAYYIPFIVVGIALAGRSDAFFATLRVFLLCGLVVCAVGLLESLLIRAVGYVPAITLFYGPAAWSVTQGFAEFTESGHIYRIPGTFSFGAQYVQFVFLFLVVAVIEANKDPDPGFRSIGRFAFYLGMLAGLFSGTKGAFLVYPALAAGFIAFGLIRGRLILWAPIAISAIVGVIGAAGVDPLGLATYGARLAGHYGGNFAVQQLGEALQHGLIGEGVGTSTGAARYAEVSTMFGGSLGFESYYAKIAAELGSIGFMIFGLFFVGIALKSILMTIEHWRTGTDALIAPMAMFILLNLAYSLKGFVLDTDPGNIYFWLLLGMMLRLHQDARALRRKEATVSALHPRIPAPGVPDRSAVGG